MSGKLYVVGLGPGDLQHMTPACNAALEEAAVIVGYQTYLDLIAPLLVGKEVISSGMMKEVDRCRQALEIAATGKIVALVSSGDAGIYGMAGLVLELVNEPGRALEAVAVEMIPGVSAVQAAASRLGAPLMHDFAVISLSDLLTPWPLIRRRLDAAGRADFVIALYNPRSKSRVTQIEEGRDILLRHRSPDTPVGIVRNACRVGESVTLSTLATFTDEEINMFSLVMIGNSATFIDTTGRMITPRGYAARYLCTDKASAPLPTKRVQTLFVGGTGSDVGKSLVVAGLCRLLKRQGKSVAPFKAQNMALNSAVTPEGGEIGRAQALQAAACGLAPHTDMNPVLLKPNSATGSQVIVHGKPIGNMSVTEYHAYKDQAFVKVRESFKRLATQYDLVIMEGAGSIAEINLKATDITNLRAAAIADAPVLLVADIDRGGVFAAIVGTLELLTQEERAAVAGVIINKFRGDPALLESGLREIEDRTGVPVLGVIPWLKLRLPEEDSVALTRKVMTAPEALVRIGVVRLPHLSNYTDFDPLEQSPGVGLSYFDEPRAIAALDLIILPGSKSTLADLIWLQETGMATAISAYHAAGGRVIGICGGYQMLGHSIADPDGVESALDSVAGLGLLDVTTTLFPDKQTHLVRGELLPAARRAGLTMRGEITGYEIHMGETLLTASVAPLLQLSERSQQRVALNEGAISADGRVWGSYLHGLFDNAELTRDLLTRIAADLNVILPAGDGANGTSVDAELDRWADHLATHLDLQKIFSLLNVEPEK
ncbi:MAG: cobyric acid synthase [Desulfuromonadaceae bacterium]|nr:cobyric acid synthase [Desulfuromonadaceae bacterium]